MKISLVFSVKSEKKICVDVFFVKKLVFLSETSSKAGLNVKKNIFYSETFNLKLLSIGFICSLSPVSPHVKHTSGKCNDIIGVSSSP